MPLSPKQAAAAAIVEKHFQTFVNSPAINGQLKFSITDVQTVTPKTNRRQLAKDFSRRFVFLKLNAKGRPVGLRKFSVNKSNSKEAIKLALPLFKGARFFVTLAVKYKGKSETLHAIVKNNAKPGDFARLIDPLTPSPIGVPTVHHSKLTYTIGFAYRSGTSCHFEVVCTATCDGSTAIACAGGPRFFNDCGSYFNQGPCDRSSPITNTGRCCQFTYQLQMDYGLSGAKVKFKKGGFEIDPGSLCTTIFKVGPEDMNDCCPPPKTLPVPPKTGSGTQTPGDGEFGTKEKRNCGDPPFKVDGEAPGKTKEKASENAKAKADRDAKKQCPSKCPARRTGWQERKNEQDDEGWWFCEGTGTYVCGDD